MASWGDGLTGSVALTGSGSAAGAARDDGADSTTGSSGEGGTGEGFFFRVRMGRMAGTRLDSTPGGNRRGEPWVDTWRWYPGRPRRSTTAGAEALALQGQCQVHLARRCLQFLHEKIERLPKCDLQRLSRASAKGSAARRNLGPTRSGSPEKVEKLACDATFGWRLSWWCCSGEHALQNDAEGVEQAAGCYISPSLLMNSFEF